MSQDFSIPAYTPEPLPVYTQQPPRQSNSTKWFIGCLVSFFLCICLICCGLPILTGVGLGGAAAVLLSNKVTESDSQTFRLESEGVAELELAVDNAEVIITPGTSQELIIAYDLNVYGFTESSARNALQNDYEVLIERVEGDSFRLSLDTTSSAFSIYDAVFTITAPPEMQLIQLDTTDDITIDGITSDFRLNTSTSGYVTLTDVSGSFDVSVTGLLGEIRFGGSFAPGSNNRFNASTGEIDLAVRDASNLTYTLTTTGSITCPDTPIGNTCQGDSGDVAKSPASLTVTSGGGDVYLRFVP